ncbi:YdcF family protein [Flindersiella endophytica]
MVAVLLCVLGLVALAVLVIGWAEIVHWRSTRRLTRPDPGSGSEAIVVLGYRNPDRDHINALNRWRVRAGLRSIDGAGTSRLVLSGGPYEASLMARYATEQCGYAGEVVVEDVSRTTWENVEQVIPFLEDVERIKFVSNPLHAEKARLYLQLQRPDLAERMVRAADHCIGEWAPLKPLFAVYGLRDLAKHKRNLAAQGRLTP